MSAQTKPDFHSLPDGAFVRQRQLFPDVLPFSPATLWRKVGEGKFPKPISFGPNITAWKVGAIREWLEAQNAL